MAAGPLNIPLGPNGHQIIRAAIGLSNRAYAPFPFVHGHALTLVGAGFSAAEARQYLLHLIGQVPLPADFGEAIALGGGLRAGPGGWGYTWTEQCADDFLTNRNGLTGVQWATIGRALGNNQRAATAHFARLAGWNYPSILLLAQGFAGNNPNHFIADHWATLAAFVGANLAAETNGFASITGWTMLSIRALVQSFQGQPHGLSAANWATIASQCIANQHVDAIAFAGIPAWGAPAKILLAQNYHANNPNNLTAAQWVTLAGYCGANSADLATTCARIPGWTIAGINALAQAFVLANPNNFTPANWATIAATLGVDEHAQTAAFACIVGWNLLSITTLSGNFHANNVNNHTANEWAIVATAVGINLHADTTAFVRMRGLANTAWNHASVLLLVQARTAIGGNPNNFTVAEWIAIAALLPQNAHANVISLAQAAGWPHASVITLATLFVANAFHHTVADWITVANRSNRVGWAAETARGMQHRSHGWPDQIQIRTVAGGPLAAWHLEGSDDGLVYRRTGIPSPHITLHNLPLVDSPDNWWYPGNFHVVSVRPYDYYRRNFTPFVGRGAPAQNADIQATAESFCAALGF